MGGLGLGISCIVLGTTTRRAEIPSNRDFSYGSALGAGVMITLFAAVIGLSTNYLYGTVTNPNFREVMIEAQALKLEAKGVPADKIEQFQKTTAVRMKPPVLAAIGFMSGMFFGTLISLVTAAFLKRVAVDADPAAPPALG